MKSVAKLIFFFVLFPISSAASIKLPAFLTDNMVVQQHSALIIHGTARPHATVKVTSGWGETARAKSDGEGNFTLTVKTPAAGGPYSLNVSDGSENRTLHNILAGEVWLCSGQSNMEFPVNGWTSVMDYQRIISTAQHPDIRLLQVTKQTAFAPQDDCRVNMGGWVECTPVTVQDFSAIAYLYALEILNELKVPVGVIDATWGGTPAEAWTSLGGVKKVPGFEAEVSALEQSGFDADRMAADYERRTQEWRQMALELQNNSKDTGIGGKMPTGKNWEDTVLPSGFNGVVAMTKTIDIPAEAAGKPVTLYLGALDDEDVTYFNGTEIARGSGFNIPRVYQVPAELVKQGKAEIKVCVTDFEGGGGFNGGDTMRAECDGTAISLEGDWDYTVLVDFAQLPAKPVSVNGAGFPTVLYNAMIHPLADMPVRGVIWYQGCANVGRHDQYAPLFKQLINDWRELWKQPEMPFHFVQLAGYLKPSYCQPESEWAALRAAQAEALALNHTGMAVAIDLGNPGDIHPRNKQDVAHRLALIALSRQYGKNVVYAAPKLSETQAKAGKLLLKFDAALSPRSVALTGFIIAGKDGKFVPAYARLVDSQTVELSAPDVKKPVAARYNWADYPGGNLYGETGLPVAPFKSGK